MIFSADQFEKKVLYLYYKLLLNVGTISQKEPTIENLLKLTKN